MHQVKACDRFSSIVCSPDRCQGCVQSPLSDALALPPCTRGCSVITPWKNSLWHPSIWGSILFLPRVRLWSRWHCCVQMVVIHRKSWANVPGAACQCPCCMEKTSERFVAIFRRLHLISTLYRSTQIWAGIRILQQNHCSKSNVKLSCVTHLPGGSVPGASVAPSTFHHNSSHVSTTAWKINEGKPSCAQGKGAHKNFWM